MAGDGGIAGLCRQTNQLSFGEQLNDLVHDIARIVGGVKFDNLRHSGLGPTTGKMPSRGPAFAAHGMAPDCTNRAQPNIVWRKLPIKRTSPHAGSNDSRTPVNARRP